MWQLYGQPAWRPCSGVSQLLSQPRPQSDGVRMLAARFLETAMLLISAEPSSTAKAPKAQHALLSAASVSYSLLRTHDSTAS